MNKMIYIAVGMGIIAAGRIEAMHPEANNNTMVTLIACDSKNKSAFSPWSYDIQFLGTADKPFCRDDKPFNEQVRQLESITEKQIERFKNLLQADLKAVYNCYPKGFQQDFSQVDNAWTMGKVWLPAYQSREEIVKLTENERRQAGRKQAVTAQWHIHFPDKGTVLYDLPILIRSLNETCSKSALPVPEIEEINSHRIADIILNSEGVTELWQGDSKKFTGILVQMNGESHSKVFDWMKELAGSNEEKKERYRELLALHVQSSLDKLSDSLARHNAIVDPNRLAAFSVIVSAGAYPVIKSLMKK